MTVRKSYCAVMAICLTAGSAVFAQHGDRSHEYGRAEFGFDYDYERSRDGGRDREVERERHDRDERGAGPRHDIYRGRRLPDEYRNRNYVVSDWRAHHLGAPPRGYEWVQIGDDYALVSTRSGIVVQIVFMP